MRERSGNRPAQSTAGSSKDVVSRGSSFPEGIIFILSFYHAPPENARKIRKYPPSPAFGPVGGGNNKGVPIGTPILSGQGDLAAAIVIAAAAVVPVAAVVAAAAGEQQDQNDDPPPVVAVKYVAQITVITAHKNTSDPIS